jgi:hypothetical protein
MPGAMIKWKLNDIKVWYCKIEDNRNYTYRVIWRVEPHRTPRRRKGRSSCSCVRVLHFTKPSKRRSTQYTPKIKIYFFFDYLLIILSVLLLFLRMRWTVKPAVWSFDSPSVDRVYKPPSTPRSGQKAYNFMAYLTSRPAFELYVFSVTISPHPLL